MKFKVVEVGSTNTKAYLCDQEIQSLGFKTIEFKNHYKQNGKLLESDKLLLINYINELKSDNEKVYVYGTSIFRNLKEQERIEWLTYFKEKTDVNFEIVSPSQENEYTCYGVLKDLKYDGNVAIMIGGGGSTEISILNKGKKVFELNSDFGAMDVCHEFPSLTEDIAKEEFNSLVSWALNKIEKTNIQADLLILAGGDFLKFYQELNFEMEKNTFYESKEQPFILNNSLMKKYDEEFFYHTSLENVKKSSKDADWWSGTRGMRICVRAFYSILNAKYIVPTRITMVDGIVAKINQDN